MRAVTANRRVWLTAAAALAVFVLVPALADACPVCMAQRDDASRTAFLLTTGFLTLLPLAMIGGAIAWLRWRWIKLQREDALEQSRAAESGSDRDGQRAWSPRPV